MSRLVLLQMSLRVGKMAGPGGVATADRALLEVALEDVASRKRIAAENAHIWAVTSVCGVELARIEEKQSGLVKTYV